MKVYIGADHRGVGFKKKTTELVQELGHEVIDVGTNDPKVSCDYPVIAYDVATSVVKSRNSRGILICMSGIGQSIAANKVDGALAALCYNSEAAKLSREHNNANILVLSAKFVKAKELKKILTIWFDTKFEGGRHLRRVKQMRKIEKGLMRAKTKGK